LVKRTDDMFQSFLHSLVTNQLQCILSYDDNAADVRINYTLLFINLAVACLPFLQSHRQNRQRDVLCALCSLSFVTAFQIVLCILVDCTGVSIIWCAIGGWILMEWQKKTANSFISWNQKYALCIDAVAIIYYAMVEPPITTLAHFLAVVILGIPLHSITFSRILA